MEEDIYNEKFLTKENFILAYKRIQTVKKNFYKEIYYNDINIFGFNLESNIEVLIHKIKEGIYEPKKTNIYYVPKKKNLARPISLLSFIDLLVYQAIINIIAQIMYEKLYPLYDVVLFGNQLNKPTKENEIFFYKKWDKQWKKYKGSIEKNYNAGYEYTVDFDIASYYDMIDHKILKRNLEEYDIPNNIIELLMKCLEKWTTYTNSDVEYIKGRGIPQGPNCSGILGEIYLLSIDHRIMKTKLIDIKYCRYVDDMRIMAKSELEGRKAIAYLDILCRDIGLIPQNEKIGITKIVDIKKELYKFDSKFSEINREYKTRGDLNKKTNKKLKKQFLNCFDSNNENYLNKTLIKFSLFKLNKDEYILQCILKNINDLYLNFEAVAFYINKYYKETDVFDDTLEKLLNEDIILFNYIISIIFKNFSTMEYDEKIFNRFWKKNERHWIVKYYLIDWLKNNNQNELLLQLEENNYFISRKLNETKLNILSTFSGKRQLIEKMINSNDDMIGLQAENYIFTLNLLGNSLDFEEEINKSSNEYLKNIYEEVPKDYINYHLNNTFRIENSELFFNKSIWKKEEYKELKDNFQRFIRYMNSDAGVSVMNLDLINEQITRKIIEVKYLETISKELDYGSFLPKIEEDFPNVYLFFYKIHKSRCQGADAHLYDDFGNIRVRIKPQIYKKIIDNYLEAAYEEIINNYEK